MAENSRIFNRFTNDILNLGSSSGTVISTTRKYLPGQSILYQGNSYSVSTVIESGQRVLLLDGQALVESRNENTTQSKSTTILNRHSPKITERKISKCPNIVWYRGGDGPPPGGQGSGGTPGNCSLPYNAFFSWTASLPTFSGSTEAIQIAGAPSFFLGPVSFSFEHFSFINAIACVGSQKQVSGFRILLHHAGGTFLVASRQLNCSDITLTATLDVATIIPLFSGSDDCYLPTDPEAPPPTPEEEAAWLANQPWIKLEYDEKVTARHDEEEEKLIVRFTSDRNTIIEEIPIKICEVVVNCNNRRDPDGNTIN